MLIRQYDQNLALTEIDQLFSELDESGNGFVFYEFLISAYEQITEEDNPTQELNRKSKLIGTPSKKREFDVLIEIKDLLMMTGDYLSAIEVFITEKDGHLTR